MYILCIAEKQGEATAATKAAQERNTTMAASTRRLPPRQRQHWKLQDVASSSKVHYMQETQNVFSFAGHGPVWPCPLVFLSAYCEGLMGSGQN